MIYKTIFAVVLLFSIKSFAVEKEQESKTEINEVLAKKQLKIIIKAIKQKHQTLRKI